MNKFLSLSNSASVSSHVANDLLRSSEVSFNVTTKSQGLAGLSLREAPVQQAVRSIGPKAACLKYGGVLLRSLASYVIFIAMSLSWSIVSSYVQGVGVFPISLKKLREARVLANRR